MKSSILSLMMALAMIVIFCSPEAGAAEMASKDKLMKFYVALADNKVDALDEIIIKDWISHDLNPGQQPGRAGLKAFIPLIHKSVTGLTWKVEEMIQEGNVIVVRSTFGGKHTGPLLGVEATGKTFSAKAIDIHHFNAEGMVTHTYHVEDWIAFLAQVGAFGK